MCPAISSRLNSFLCTKIFCRKENGQTSIPGGSAGSGLKIVRIFEA
jgi:hypothetical protein